jgi:hypothetical protein
VLQTHVRTLTARLSGFVMFCDLINRQFRRHSHAGDGPHHEDFVLHVPMKSGPSHDRQCNAPRSPGSRPGSRPPSIHGKRPADRRALSASSSVTSLHEGNHDENTEPERRPHRRLLGSPYSARRSLSSVPSFFRLPPIGDHRPVGVFESERYMALESQMYTLCVHVLSCPVDSCVTFCF